MNFIKPTVVFLAANFTADVLLNKEHTFHNHSEQQYPIVSQAVKVYGNIHTTTGATQEIFGQARIITGEKF
jgi:hypothetical protein